MNSDFILAAIARLSQVVCTVIASGVTVTLAVALPLFCLNTLVFKTPFKPCLNVNSDVGIVSEVRLWSPQNGIFISLLVL